MHRALVVSLTCTLCPLFAKAKNKPGNALNPEGSDTTGDATCTAAGTQKLRSCLIPIQLIFAP